MGWLERFDRHQQEVHERTARDGIQVTPGAKRIMGLSFGGSMVIMLVIVVILIGRAIGG